jgi:L-amino acid N-acyltransferase YncA
VVVALGSIVAMSLVVVVNERHYIDPVATASGLKGTGLGRDVVGQSLSLLAADHVEEVGAVITDGNVPSERLFASLDFTRVGVWG